MTKPKVTLKKPAKEEGRKPTPTLDTTFMLPSPEGYREMNESELGAEKRGYTAAMTPGEVSGNPFPADNSEAGAWEKGYHRGLAELNRGNVAKQGA